MASPEPATHEGQQDTKITFKFCRECSNMLYPSEDRENNKLYFACRTCPYSEPPPNACIYRNDLSNTATDTAGITQDIGVDPTLPRANKKCPNPACTSKEDEAVFFQSQQRTAETGMKLYFVCTACGFVFQ